MEILSVTPSKPRVLMCRPDYYDVAYEINAWMKGNTGMANIELARNQWDTLFDAVQSAGATIELLTPHPNVPDLVFTANGGLVWGRRVLLPRFAHPERQGEEPFFREWFESQGYAIVEVPHGEYFEGEGDVVVRDQLLFLGTHARTSPATKKSLEELTGLEVVMLQLNPRGYYHLDTCMFSDGVSGTLFYCPEAFTQADREEIVRRLGPKCVPVSLDEAKYFACNTIILGSTAISPTAPASFAEKLQAAGLSSVMVDLSEFMKAGGAAKCLVLYLGNARE